MPRIFVTRALVIDAAELIGGAVEVETFAPDRPPTAAELLERAHDADALLVVLPTRIDAALLDRMPRLRILANVAVGFDNLDVAAATERGIWVTNTPDVLTHAVAELTWALILAAARKLTEGDRMIRRGDWKGFSPTMLLGTELFGRTLGIMGLGRIGRAVAAIGAAFGMRIIASSGSSLQAAREVGGVHIVDHDTLLRESDVLSIHAPASASTKHAIGKTELAKMKRGAMLVNTSRGSIIDEDALADALSSGQIGAVGLDVFEQEPIVPQRILASDRAVLLPHIGSATFTARSAMARLAITDALLVLEGKSPMHPVNPDVQPRGAL